MTRNLWSLLALLVVVLGLSGCSTVPGALRRHMGSSAAFRGGDEELAKALDVVAAGPESPAGKIAGGRFVEHWCASRSADVVQVGGWKVRVTGEWTPGYFDALLPAADYDVRGLQHRHVRDGKGVALVGCRKNEHRAAIESLYPPEMITRPVTAVFTAGPGRIMTIALNDPMRHTELAADFTAPLAELVGHAGTLQKLGVGGLMGTRAARQRGSGLFLLEPYNPGKTPVVFVHGLLSTPLAWANVTNDLWGDAEFRRRYQIWHYHYPTSAPFLYSAKVFRQQLAEAQKRLDPRGEHPASRRFDVVAHSMGGLLTRTLITDSGEDIWNQVFRVRPEALRGSAADIAEAVDILHWKARREVRDVIFIAIPHRGSEMSRGIVGRVGDTLTGLPKNFTALYARLNRDNPEALQPAYRGALSRGTLTSIDTLSPQHPMLVPLNALPVAPWVKTHSIIGNRGSRGPLERSSDGVVPYTSSHLDSAVSEIVVPTDHGAYKHPRAIAEILRILTGAGRASER